MANNVTNKVITNLIKDFQKLLEEKSDLKILMELEEFAENMTLMKSADLIRQGLQPTPLTLEEIKTTYTSEKSNGGCPSCCFYRGRGSCVVRINDFGITEDQLSKAIGDCCKNDYYQLIENNENKKS